MRIDKWILAVSLGCLAPLASAANYGFSVATQACPGLDHFTSAHTVGDTMTELRAMPHDVEDASPARQSACTPHYGSYLQMSQSGSTCRLFDTDAIGVALFGMEDSQAKSLMGNGALLYFMSDTADVHARIVKRLRAEGLAHVPEADYPGLLGRKLAPGEQLDIYRKGDVLVTLNRDVKQHRFSAMISDASMLKVVNRDESHCGN